MKKLIILFLLILFQYNIPDTLHANTTIKVGIYDNEPLIFADAAGSGKGFFADIIEYIALKEGWQIKYVMGNWQECLSKLENNEIDILCTIAFSKARDKLYDFNKENLLTNWGQLYTLNGSGIKTITDVAGKKVAVLKEDIHSTIFIQILENFGIKTQIIETDDYHSVLDMVSGKQVDAGVVNRFFGMKYGNKYHVEKSGVIFNPIKIHFAVAEGQNKELISTIDRHVILLKENGDSVYYSSLDKWFGTVSINWMIPKWLKWALGVSSGLVLMLLFGNLVARNQIRAKTEDLSAELKRRKKSEKQFRNLFNSISDLIYTQDLEGYFTSTNPAMHELFGYDIDEFVGRKATDFMKPEFQSDFNSQYLEVVKKQGKQEGIACYFKKNKEMIYIDYISSLVEPEDGEPYISGMGRDVTEKILSEKKVRKLQEQVIQSQKMESIGTLAGGIAHDFNNILFPILGHTEMLLMDVPEESPLRNSLNGIYAGSMRARELVKQILTFARQEKGELKLMKMQPMIKEALKLIRSSIPTTIEIRQDINPDCGVIKADPTQIHQIIMNLATNASHAMEETGGKLKVSLKEIKIGEFDLTTPDMASGVYACLTVADTGVGMDKDITEKVFDPFFTTKQKGKGTGMGLAVIHGIVKRMGGTIQVYSEPDKGAEFHVYLPVVRSTPEQLGLATETKTAVQGGTERILLVDDEEGIITMERQMLERLGYQVTFRTSSIKALEIFRADPDNFDLIITDMAMPNIPGDKLSAELVKIRPDIPILLCTGFSETMSEEKAASQGIKGFLLKPVIMADLDRKIREVLDKKIFIP